MAVYTWQIIICYFGSVCLLPGAWSELLRGDDGEVAAGAGDGGVEPAIEVFHGGVGGYAAHVDEDVIPLAALGFVAGDGVSEFDLQRIEVRVGIEYGHLLARAHGCGAIVCREYGGCEVAELFA